MFDSHVGESFMVNASLVATYLKTKYGYEVKNINTDRINPIKFEGALKDKLIRDTPPVLWVYYKYEKVLYLVKTRYMSDEFPLGLGFVELENTKVTNKRKLEEVKDNAFLIIV